MDIERYLKYDSSSLSCSSDEVVCFLPSNSIPESLPQPDPLDRIFGPEDVIIRGYHLQRPLHVKTTPLRPPVRVGIPLTIFSSGKEGAMEIMEVRIAHP